MTTLDNLIEDKAKRLIEISDVYEQKEELVNKYHRLNEEILAIDHEIKTFIKNKIENKTLELTTGRR